MSTAHAWPLVLRASDAADVTQLHALTAQDPLPAAVVLLVEDDSWPIADVAASCRRLAETIPVRLLVHPPLLAGFEDCRGELHTAGAPRVGGDLVRAVATMIGTDAPGYEEIHLT